MNTEDQDTRWMNMAVKLAEKGVGLTSPNPCVGAVIVHEDQVIGSGFHEKAGLPHAERKAIADGTARGNSALFADSTLYVTLEPCSTTGKTPPCTEAILEHHFKRVVYGSQDPNPRHRGAAADILGRAGIQVTRGILEKECDHLIRGFRLNMLEGRPWVIAKSAMSLDGRISRSPERSQWLTNEKSRSFVHTLRAECDAILTGGNTMRLDNPSLTIRKPDRPVSSLKEQPWRIILTHNAASIPADSVCLTDEFRDRTLIIENV
ncbi:bifunctional diaminohydroxyphosphoribosylaminopyrimidine deaminase/5-amino-6-(5-phosphoribosylamino)uracil reductase RibD, partial [Akkermansia sp.]|uniref:bifunctional diaminohydroxyphosphoribosylaminopyrimidine deaminase/5-amino-6-(5-phosphoribosylamino)uracil reductase RibD n=1 Tax=Akkermansia sp. TaxID=1872421 RepID=UPI003AAD8E41